MTPDPARQPTPLSLDQVVAPAEPPNDQTPADAATSKEVKAYAAQKAKGLTPTEREAEAHRHRCQDLKERITYLETRVEVHVGERSDRERECERTRAALDEERRHAARLGAEVAVLR